MSSPDAYVFSTVLPAGSAFADPPKSGAGTYDLCYCESRDDTSPDTDSGEFLYRLLGVDVGGVVMTGASKCSSTPVAQVATPLDGLLPKDEVAAEFQDHFCAKKCARGCVRQDCFCDSFDPDTMYDESTVDLMAGYAAPLCLSASLCRDACSASANCAMFDYDPATNFCWLLSASDPSGCAGGDLTYDESKQTWSKVNGGACTNTTDFTKTVGTITLAGRADIGNDWVLTPSAGVGTDYVPVQSLEVTGENMDWKMDRVMLVECTGTCGVSGPAASVRSLVGVGSPGIPSQAAFNAWIAENDKMDPPAEDDYEEKEKGGPGAAKPDWEYQFKGKYCPGNNMDVTTPDMIGAGVAQHQCYHKCVTNAPCDASKEDCFCDGLFPGYDDEDSGALCLDQPTCLEYCGSLPDCFGIDMHKDMPRCFLNSIEKGPEDEKSCMEYVGEFNTMSTYNYDFIFKYDVFVALSRRLEAKPERAPVRNLQSMEPVDQGVSWNEILRFKGLAFASGGKFKACFCDKETLPLGSACSTAADYKVDIGTVHVSGVSCLIEEPKFQRGICVSQYHGGMRCYKNVAPELTVPTPPPPGASPTPQPTQPGSPPSPTPIPTPYPTPPPSVPTVISTFCFYGPEEETRSDPMCQWPQP